MVMVMIAAVNLMFVFAILSFVLCCRDKLNTSINLILLLLLPRSSNGRSTLHNKGSSALQVLQAAVEFVAHKLDSSPFPLHKQTQTYTNSLLRTHCVWYLKTLGYGLVLISFYSHTTRILLSFYFVSSLVLLSF